MLDVLVLLLLQNPVAEELRSAQRFFDKGVWAAINSNPAHHHNSIRNSAQVAIHWVGPVGFFELGRGHDSIVDRFKQILVNSQARSRGARLCGLGSNEQEFSLFLETPENLRRLHRSTIVSSPDQCSERLGGR